MSKSLATELTERRTALIKQATEIAKKGVAEGRDLSDSEQTEFDSHIAEAEALQDRAKAIRDGEQRSHELEDSFRSVTGASPRRHGQSHMLSGSPHRRTSTPGRSP